MSCSSAGSSRWSSATKSRFENLLDLSPQVVWFGQPDGQISYCNPYWYEYTGLSERQTVGYGWADAIHPDERHQVVETVQSALQQGKDYEVEFRLRKSDPFDPSQEPNITVALGL